LTTCLLILALQIHNPFQTAGQRRGSCECPSDRASTEASGGFTASSHSAATPSESHRSSSRAGAYQQPQSLDDSESAPVYRRPQKQVPPTSANKGGKVGLSTDELLRELDSIQVKAKEQQETLAAAGRMPPASPILQQLKESEEPEVRPRARPVAAAPAMPPAVPHNMPPAIPPSSSLGADPGLGLGAGFGADAMQAQHAPGLRRRDDIGRFLDARQPRGLGVVLGVGRGDFALRLLGDWSSAGGVYLVDPFIHIWRGYNDPANVPDREHQLIFEDLRNRLVPYEGRYVLVRDFSHSFAELYRQGGTAPGLPAFVYIDANHGEEAVSRDLELWWPLLSPGGMLAGSTYMDDAEGSVRVRTAVDRFAARRQLQLFLTHDDAPPSWFFFKN